jgi:hypothetical protein
MRAADDANATCQENSKALPNFCHRDKIWLPNEVKADGAAGCDSGSESTAECYARTWPRKSIYDYSVIEQIWRYTLVAIL